MTGSDILSIEHQRLAEAVAKAAPPPREHPLAITPWLAMSLLQKAIRRGREELALRAAATLLRDAPDRLWRRMGCIAWEDVGLADLDAVFLATAALSGKTARSRLGGEWPVASLLVTRLARAWKCRAADDLLLIAQGHPAYKQPRRDLVTAPTRELLEVATGGGPLPERAIALWFALGTTRPSKTMQARRGEPRAVFDHLCDRGMPHLVGRMACEAHRRTGEVLAPFVALLAPARLAEAATVAHDDIPPEGMVGAIPGWCVDVYCREGRRALALFLTGTSNTAIWVRKHVPGLQRVKFLGDVVFRLEGGLCTSRLRWRTADELRRLVDIYHGPHCPDAADLLDLARADLPLLQEARRYVM